MEVFVLAALEGFDAEVLDNEQIDAGQFGELAVKGVDGPACMQLREPLALGRKKDIMPGADGAMAQGLRNMALAGPAGPKD